MNKHFFFDTSALVKLYHEEAGTEKLSSLIISENPVIAEREGLNVMAI